MTALTGLCALGAATSAGAFFTFSDFTMQGLRGMEPARGAAAMQAINRAAPSPLFMILLFGTGAACLALGVLAGGRLEETGSWLRVVAAGLYVVGVVITTIAYHVPRNERLDGLDPESEEGRSYWAVYGREWTRMNHVRTLTSLVAAALLVVSLLGEA